MVTASHLPSDRNGFKLFSATNGGFTKAKIQQIGQLAVDFCQQWHDREGMLPPTSGGEGVFCSKWVDFMPQYADTLKDAIRREVGQTKDSASSSAGSGPLEGLKIVLNSGNGSGGFFYKVLQDLGADVSASVHIEPDSEFPAGVPNPEYAQMIEETTSICKETGADLGIMLDTDADRAGFVVPVKREDGNVQYEPLNRNRLIALLSVIFSRTSPGCAIVTDSVTSEGLTSFIQDKLGLTHIRYLKGYANVIGKAVELTESGEANAEMAIETSGHCAMRENGYLDDGTYTSCKVIGLLAREKQAGASDGLLDLISDLKEMPEDVELRMSVKDESLDTTSNVFDLVSLEIEEMCDNESLSLPWSLDTENLEGIRVRTGHGGFFMLRKSLHDPLISLQVEANDRYEAETYIVKPLLERFQTLDQIQKYLDMKVLEKY
jgi:phosphomannomutase